MNIDYIYNLHLMYKVFNLYNMLKLHYLYNVYSMFNMYSIWSICVKLMYMFMYTYMCNMYGYNIYNTMTSRSARTEERLIETFFYQLYGLWEPCLSERLITEWRILWWKTPKVISTNVDSMPMSSPTVCWVGGGCAGYILLQMFLTVLVNRKRSGLRQTS